MARSTRKSLADVAVAAAKRVMPGGAKAAAKKAAPVKKSAPGKKAAPAAKKATPVSKAPAKKAAPAKKSPPAKKSSAPAKKAAPAAKKAPTKKAAPAKVAAPAKKTAPARKTAPANKALAKKAPAKKAPAKKAAPVAAATPAKKAAPVRKTAPKRLVVREDESEWTQTELDEVLEELNSHAARLRQELDDQEAELAGLLRDAGDGAGQDQADMGATSFERDHELTVVNNAREMLKQIDRALERIEDHTYGVCESCGKPIGKMRLMAFPRATLCLSCKQREERR